MDYKKMKMENIIEWCVEHKEVNWLKEVALKENAEGKLPSFFQIRKAFCLKFMPEIMPTAAPKKPTMYDLIAAL